VPPILHPIVSFGVCIVGKFNLPYSSMAEAIQDRFARVGGTEKAFSMLKRGFYNTRYHEDAQKSDKAILAMVKADPSLLEKISSDKADAQLGRKPAVGDPRLVKKA